MLKVESKDMSEALSRLKTATDNLPRQVNIALGKAVQVVQREIAKAITAELNVKQKVIKKQLSRRLDRANLKAAAVVNYSYRIPLREFGAKQNRKGQVTAKVNKTGPRKVYDGAFVVVKFGNHIFHRPGGGRKISKLAGASPWGVIKHNTQVREHIINASKGLVRKEIDKRTRYLELKKAGKI